MCFDGESVSDADVEGLKQYRNAGEMARQNRVDRCVLWFSIAMQMAVLAV